MAACSDDSCFAHLLGGSHAGFTRSDASFVFDLLDRSRPFVPCGRGDVSSRRLRAELAIGYSPATRSVLWSPHLSVPGVLTNRNTSFASRRSRCCASCSPRRSRSKAHDALRLSQASNRARPRHSPAKLRGFLSDLTVDSARVHVSKPSLSRCLARGPGSKLIVITFRRSRDLRAWGRTIFAITIAGSRVVVTCLPSSAPRTFALRATRKRDPLFQEAHLLVGSRPLSRRRALLRNVCDLF